MLFWQEEGGRAKQTRAVALGKLRAKEAKVLEDNARLKREAQEEKCTREASHSKVKRRRSLKVITRKKSYQKVLIIKLLIYIYIYIYKVMIIHVIIFIRLRRDTLWNNVVLINQLLWSCGARRGERINIISYYFLCMYRVYHKGKWGDEAC